MMEITVSTNAEIMSINTDTVSTSSSASTMPLTLFLNGMTVSATDSDGSFIDMQRYQSGQSVNQANADSIILNCKKKEPMLMLASKAGDATLVKQLICDGVDVNHKDENLFFALHYAAFYDKSEVVKVLINAGAFLNCQNLDGETPLLIASRKCYMEVVEELIQHKAEVDIIDVEGKTALHHASNLEFFDVINVLLNYGANIHIQDKYGWTALFYAAKNGFDCVVDMLINAGAKVNIKDAKGATPLYYSVVSNELVVQKLIQYGAEVNDKNTVEQTVLGHAIREAFRKEKADLKETTQENQFSVLNDFSKTIGFGDIELIANDFENKIKPLGLSDVHIRNMSKIIISGDEDSQADLQGYINSVKAGYGEISKIIETLLDYGADINTLTDDQKNLLLMIAVNIGNIQIVEILVANGVNVNYCNDIGTALYNVTLNNINQVDLIQILVNAGASVNCLSPLARTPLLETCISNFEYSAKILVDLKADVNCHDLHGMSALHYAAKNNPNIVNTLLNAGSSVYCQDSKNWTPLFYAVEGGNSVITSMLINAKAFVNLVDVHGISLLYYAVDCNVPSIVNILINAGANVGLQNKNGKTMLGCAIKNKNLEMINALVLAGSDLKILSDKKKGLLLIIAVCKGDKALVKKIINVGFDKNFVDENKLTALYHAFMHNHADIIEILIEAGACMCSGSQNYRLGLLHAIKYAPGIINILIDFGVDVNIQDEYGYNSLFYAINNLDATRILIDAKVDMNVENAKGQSLLIYAIYFGSVDVVRLLLKAGCVVNWQQKIWENVLKHLAINKNINMVMVLLEEGLELASVNESLKKDFLKLAIFKNNKVLVQMIINSGCSLNFIAENGRDVLHYSVANNYADFVDMLVCVGVSMSYEGWIPLLEASSHGHEDVVKRLIALKVDVNKTDEKGKTALHYAVE